MVASSVSLAFLTVVDCNTDIEIYLAVLKAQSKSDYELDKNTEYKKTCDAYEKICSKL